MLLLILYFHTLDKLVWLSHTVLPLLAYYIQMSGLQMVPKPSVTFGALLNTELA